MPIKRVAPKKIAKKKPAPMAKVSKKKPAPMAKVSKKKPAPMMGVIKPVTSKKGILSILDKSIKDSTLVQVYYKRKRDAVAARRLLEPYEVKEVMVFPLKYVLFLYAIDTANVGDERHIKRYIINNIRSIKATMEKFTPRTVW